MIPIYENYRDYESPRYVKRTIARLLSNLPKQYLSGLQSVVLTNAAAIGRGKTRRIGGKKYHREQCLGWYHPKTGDDQAWIEFVVDNVVTASFLSRAPKAVSQIPFLQDLALSRTLFHEIGHHLNSTIGAPARGDEGSANAWIPHLIRCYFRKHYWYLVPFVRPAKALVDRVNRRRREKLGAQT